MANKGIMSGSGNKESEKVLEAKLRENVKARGGWCLKLLSKHINGLPDRLCLFPGGRVAFAEIKTTGQKPKLIQLEVHRKLRKMGFYVEVIDSTDSLQNFLKTCENRSKPC